jgi:hypothetical protein
MDIGVGETTVTRYGRAAGRRMAPCVTLAGKWFMGAMWRGLAGQASDRRAGADIGRQRTNRAALAGLLNLTGGVILDEGTAVLIIANGLRMLRRPAAATAWPKTAGSSSTSSTGPSSAGSPPGSPCST